MGQLVRRLLDYDGGRLVSVYVPTEPPLAVVFAGDGQLIAPWGADLEAADLAPTMVVGVHRVGDPAETRRLGEYSPSFDPERFAAHERFVLDDVRTWVATEFGVALPVTRTIVAGASAGAELSLALGLRHPDVFGAIFAASPGGGYRPPDRWPGSVPRTYLTAGTAEPFFLANALTWADALRGAGVETVMTECDGGHGDGFWRTEFVRMVGWALRC